MRNYELINEIYAELIAGNGKGQFQNPYLNTCITLTKLIEKERPELKDVKNATEQEFRHRELGIAEDGTVTSIK
tara:strand:- start:1273 stop:1494 length:222 start_codon:yes stop_codon:yes gene_type:complete